MERRVLLAIVLSFLVLYTYQVFVVKPVPRPATGPATVTTTPIEGPRAAEAVASSNPAAAAPAVAVPPATSPVLGASGEQDIRIETHDVIAVLTNRGARLKSWRLRHYLDANQEPLELIATDLGATHPLPFSLRVDDDRVTSMLNAMWRNAAMNAAAPKSIPAVMANWPSMLNQPVIHDHAGPLLPGASFADQ